VVFAGIVAIIPVMMHRNKALVSILSSLLVCVSHSGAVPSEGPAPDTASGNPYRAIVDRNVFGLKSPPPPPDPEANKPPPPKITPTGITTIFGNKRALFKVQMPARPPEPAKEQSFILTEGQREGQIEVLEIDEKLGSIKFNNFGTVVTLTLEKDGAKLPNTPPAALPPPGVPVPAGFAPPAAAANPYTPPGGTVTTIGGSSAGLKSIPTRTLRLPSAPGGVGGVGGVTPQTTAPGQQLTHEEQVILMEVERERTKQAVANGALPPLPPTELTPPGSTPVKQSQSGVPPLPQ
jgi:hypothetical protein